MFWWIVGGVVAAVAFVIWIWLELINAPTINDDTFTSLVNEDDKLEA